MGFRRSAVRNSAVLVLLGFSGLVACARAADATMTVGGAEQQISGSWDSGYITISFNGFVESVHYGQFSTAASVASALAGMFSRDYIGEGLCAHASGGAISFHLKGSATFGPVSITGPSISFQMSPSGWTTEVAVADHGTVQLTVNGVVAATANYGIGSTPNTLADALADGVTSNSPVTIATVGDQEISGLYLQAKTGGSNTDYSYSLQTTSYDSTDFAQPSFQAASGNLQGGTDANPSNGQKIYGYNILYNPNNTIQGYTDYGGSSGSIMGAWAFTYDTLDRLRSMDGSQPGNSFTDYCWSYDAFGNRTDEEQGTAAFQGGGASSCSPQYHQAFSYNVNNQVSGGPVSLSYDQAGNITADSNQQGTHQYLYDAEGRVCAVKGPGASGGTLMTGYVYDAEGRRVAKGTISSWSCDPSTNGLTTLGNEVDYILNQGGQQLSEMVEDGYGNMDWDHTNVWAGGQLIATYSAITDANDEPSGALHFYLNDWLGTRRAQTDYAGVLEQTCSSLPYGDGESCPSMPTENLFTGKERDTESGNDYFGARYYASTMGRFLSPDYDGDDDDPEPLTYSDLENPQTFNLYGYVANNPLGRIDPDGHDSDDEDGEGDGQQAGTIPLVVPTVEAPTAGEIISALLSASPIGIGVALGAGPAMLFPKNLDCGCLPQDAQGNLITTAAATASASTATMAKHSKRRGSKKKTNDKHTKPRPGRNNTKDRQNPNWRPYRDYVRPKNVPTPPPPPPPPDPDTSSVTTEQKDGQVVQPQN